MSQTVSPLSRSPFPTEPDFHSHRTQPMPRSRPSRGTTPKQEDRMEITTPPRVSPRQEPPPTSSPPDADHDMFNANGKSKTATSAASRADPPPTTNGNSSSNTLSAAAAATSSQPKVVQTAFIHKLYSMLEDQSISHLISWSSTNDSFVMSPSQDFSKVLAQYFKHTNISSFVRQLNMYGFHKVSDVFHTGQPESALWEFKHGQGNFKKGDLNSLREIRRRASRHALIHRDSFSSPNRPSVSQPGTPAEPLPETAPPDPRLNNIDTTLYDLHARLTRTEESNTALSSKCAYLSENLARCQQWNNELAQIIMKIIPDQDSQVYRDLSTIQQDMARQNEAARAHDDARDPYLAGRQAHYGQMGAEPGMPLSPRQVPPEERRPSIQGPSGRSTFFRPPVPHTAAPARRYGSIGNNAHLPSYNRRPSITVQAPHTSGHVQHPLASVTEPDHGSMSGPNLARRHTSADIRDTAGWPPQVPPLGNDPAPHESDARAPPPPWPPSPPGRTDPQTQHLRDSLGGYVFGRRSSVAEGRAGATSPPPPHVDPGAPAPAPAPPAAPPASGPFENGWSFAAASNNKPAPRFPAADSAPATRRSSMASNVHSLLNPAAESKGNDDYAPEERTKRKRVV